MSALSELQAQNADLRTEVARRQADVQMGLKSIRAQDAEIATLKQRLHDREIFHDRKWAEERRGRLQAERMVFSLQAKLDEIESLKS